MKYAPKLFEYAFCTVLGMIVAILFFVTGYLWIDNLNMLSEVIRAALGGG